MKRKILVPIMALAIAVTAGVNYKMISRVTNVNKISLRSFVKMSVAQAESHFNGPDDWEISEADNDGCSSYSYAESFTYEDGSSYTSLYTNCAGSSGSCTEVSYSFAYDTDGNYIEYEAIFVEINC